MKRELFSILLVLFSVLVDAQNFTVDNITYTVSKSSDYWEGEGAIITAIARTGDIIIPATVEYEGKQYEVKAIESTFANNPNVNSISLPNTIVAIYSNAFNGCKVSEIHMGVGLKFVGEYGLPGTDFMYISDLERWLDIDWAGYNEKPSRFLLNGTVVTNLEIPATFTELKPYALSCMSNLKSVVIPNTITKIGHHAFYHLSNLISVTIPNSVTSIGKGAFAGCALTQNFVLPNSITSIEDETFLFSGIVSIDLPESITSIGKSAFYYSNKLEYIDLPSNITSIGEEAFESCKSLKEVKLPKNLKEIPSFCFRYCENLTDIYVPKSIEKVGTNAFFGCEKLNRIDIEDLTAWLKNNLFYITFVKNSGKQRFQLLINGVPCKNMVIPEEVTSFRDGSISGCTSIETLQVHGGVNLTNFSLTDCSNLTHIDLLEGVKYIGSLSYSPVKTMNIPKSMLSIDKGDTYTSLTDIYYAGSEDEWELISGIDKIPSKVRIHFGESGSGKEEESKCKKPTIELVDGRLVVSTATESATCKVNISSDDIKSLAFNEASSIRLSGIYNITAYAYKYGLQDSDVSTAMVIWTTSALSQDSPTAARTISVDSTPLLITQSEGVLTVSGLQDGDIISGYSTDGKCVATSKAIGNAALLNLSELQGKIAVLNVVGKSAKVMVK